ncbi:MAG: cation ABC transporter substrate-binding protein [Arcobacter sp.]|nr:MAG: cation ABC transporter substrate-binding protein [Arcobacter sp.]
MKKILIAFFTLTSLLLATEVTVSILPQKYFVEKIAQDKVKVNVMVNPGASPTTYEPKTSQMRMLSNSLIYFAIDVPFEDAWLDKFKNANKKMIIIDTADGIDKLEMSAHEHHDEESDVNHSLNEKEEHKHIQEEGHNHEGADPHIWLDPILVKIQAKNIYKALAKVDAKNIEFYRKNYETFLLELESLNNKLKKILEAYPDKAFMVFHPSWGYFAARYNLEQISIEVQGKEPKPAQLVELVHEAKKHNIKIVFVAPQFSQKGAKTISKSINANVETINPLSEKWDENLIKVANDIAKSYK